MIIYSYVILPATPDMRRIVRWEIGVLIMIHAKCITFSAPSMEVDRGFKLLHVVLLL